MNITLTVDEQVADCARAAAQAMGMSLNQAVQHVQSALHTPGRLRGWTLDRGNSMFASMDRREDGEPIHVMGR